MVRLQRHGDLAVVEIDHPPVNALSNALRAEILGALKEFFDDKVLRAAVLLCAGKTFIAGADLREFDKPPGEVTTADICRALDGSQKPVVVALHGTALGGGFEIALACHARIMAPDGRVGLPEVRVGLIPGAGGAQRLVRLVGAMAALDLVTSGRHVPADEAIKLGLVEAIATDLRKQAIARARTLVDAGALPRVRDRAVPPCDRAAFDAAVAAVRRRARGALARCVPPRRSAGRSTCPSMRRSRTSARQRWNCAAARSRWRCGICSTPTGPPRAVPEVGGRVAKTWPLKHAGVVGGGTMGSGIAISLADSGLDVTLIEVNEDAVRAAAGRVRTVYDRHLKSGRIGKPVYDERLARIRYQTNLAQLAGADIVIEAVIEELPAKLDVFGKLSAIVRRDCVLASNTSALNVNLMADVVDAPERVLGMHFFSPAHVMRLLEIVRADRTLPEVLSTAMALAKRIGKQAVISGVCDGFIGNRILAKWVAAVRFRALEDGAYPQDVDAAVEAYGFAMGPYAVADLAGLDIGWAQRRAAAPTRDPRIRYVPDQRLAVRDGTVRPEDRRRLLPARGRQAAGRSGGERAGGARLGGAAGDAAAGAGGGNPAARARRHGERGGEDPGRGDRAAAVRHRRGAGGRLRLSGLARRADVRGRPDRARRGAGAGGADAQGGRPGLGAGAAVAGNGRGGSDFCRVEPVA